jgi:diacylglycerol kinase (ATP)
MTKPGKTGIRRILQAIGFALKGLRACWRNEVAFRQEVAGMVVLVPAAFYFGDSSLEIALLLFVCMLVLIVELLNSGIEAVVDRVGHEYHELSGQAKDIGAAAVLLSLCTLGVTWGLVLFF